MGAVLSRFWRQKRGKETLVFDSSTELRMTRREDNYVGWIPDRFGNDDQRPDSILTVNVGF